MSAERDPEEIKKWQRYFAIECNNRAWELTLAARNKTEDEEMINSAHASAHHWQVAGDELNHMRSKMLLAETHALAGSAALAYQFAKEIFDFFNRSETPDWEQAFNYTIYAHAAFVAGDMESYRNTYEQAKHSIEAISDPEDKKIVLQTFEMVPVS